jgi:serine/threonine protein kinase
MLSSGTRIGPYNVESWIKEGSCGQSYMGKGGSGEDKGKIRYVKLFHRELSEREGFSDYFNQECSAIQQLRGRGIWPMMSSGAMKWKHWMTYQWFEGKEEILPARNNEGESLVITLRSLADWMKYVPSQMGVNLFRDLLIDLHCGLHHAHNAGVVHGNIKPSNILIQSREDGSFDSWLTEFALSKISGFQVLGQESQAKDVFVSQSLQFQESLKESQTYRPLGGKQSGLLEEKGDIYALGGIVKFVLEKVDSSGENWSEWESWSQQAMNGFFSNVALSMEALPGVSDLSEYGIKREKSQKNKDLSDDEIRKKREIEWERKQKLSSATFRRNITGLIGSLCLSVFLFSKFYLFFNPSPWVEYSLEGASDKYQLGFGFWSGKAWGILPAAYDEDGDGGQDVSGEWERVDGTLCLKFRKFKKVNDEDSGKKLWQFIGKGATSEDDYYSWSDYLSYDSKGKGLKFIKRVQGDEVFIPGKRGDESPNLFPEIRIRRSGGLIRKTDLFFTQTHEMGPSWSIFIGLGFLIASLMYHRMILGIPDIDNYSGKD